MREQRRFPSFLPPHAVRNGLPWQLEPISNVDEHWGHSQKNSESNSGPMPFSHW
jgi:hypothetical protein